MTNLNSLVPAGSGLTLDNAVAINNNGQILVQATNASGAEEAVLLTPVAAPGLTHHFFLGFLGFSWKI